MKTFQLEKAEKRIKILEKAIRQDCREADCKSYGFDFTHPCWHMKVLKTTNKVKP